MANVLPTLVLFMCWPRLDSLVTDITDVNSVSLLDCYNLGLHQILAAVNTQVKLLAGNVFSLPTLFLSSKNMNSPTDPPATPAGLGFIR